MRDHVSTDLEGAAYLARDDVPDDRYEDARLEELESRGPVRASRRCADCGVAIWAYCVCAMGDPPDDEPHGDLGRPSEDELDWRRARGEEAD